VASIAAFAMSYAPRSLTTPARLLHRWVRVVDSARTMAHGTSRPIDESMVRAPLEQALRTLSWTFVTLAAAVAVTRLG
jgi:hypothetical protein